MRTPFGRFVGEPFAGIGGPVTAGGTGRRPVDRIDGSASLSRVSCCQVFALKHVAAATDPCGRGSRAFVEEADPDEVVMAVAEP
jgi:hypothetical protein